jgi:hypothetical protein
VSFTFSLTHSLTHCFPTTLHHCITCFSPLPHYLTGTYATSITAPTTTAPLHHCATASLRHCQFTALSVLCKYPGWFHWRLLLITGLANAADGMEVSLLTFMSVCVGLDWDLSDSQVASIASVVFAGELVGSLIW